jgi:hypothetical protein
VTQLESRSALVSIDNNFVNVLQVGSVLTKNHLKLDERFLNFIGSASHFLQSRRDSYQFG